MTSSNRLSQTFVATGGGLPVALVLCGACVVKPLSGVYDIAAEPTGQTCGEGEDWELGRRVREVEVRFAPDEMSVMLDYLRCTRSGRVVSCASVVQEPYLIDAMLSIRTESTLFWDTVDLVSGDEKTVYSCEGTDCAALASILEMTLPCEVTWSASGVRTGDFLVLDEDTAVPIFR